MADDQAPPQRSRLAPPPTAGAATNFRAPPPAATAGSRFGFGSSAPRATTSATAARATTLSTARTSTFSSSAFGRPTFAPKATTTTTASTTLQRPSSAEGVGSRLRQKPMTAAASASAPKQATATSDLFATLASDVPPRSASGGSLPFAMGAASSSSSTAFASSYAASAVASKPAGQLFSMDDSDLGGDDGWGVDSPSNILSPASATDEKTTAAGASKPFEEEDEFGWADETPVTTAPPPPVPVAVATPFAPEPTPVSQAPPTELKFEEPASAPAVAVSSTRWGDEFAYNADAIEAPADEIGWNDEDEWGTSAPKANGTAAPAIEAVAEAPKTPVEPVATPVYVQAPPLSTASADLGAILSPSGPAGEFWGDEGDDVLFSDDEQPGPALEETPAPIPKVEGLSLDAEPTHEELTHEEPALEESVSLQAAANEFYYQETEINGAVAEVVVDSSEWDDEGDWGDQLRLSEVDGDIPFSPPAHAESTSDQHVEELHHFESPAPEVHVSTVSSEVALEAEIAQTNEISALDTSEHTAEEATSASVDERAYSSHSESFEAHATNDATLHTGYFDGHTHHSQNEAPAQASEQPTGFYGYGDNASYSYESHAEDVEGRQQHFGQHEGGEHHGHHVAENGGFVEEQLQETYVKETENTTVNASDDREHGEHTHETFQRQVSWETHDEEFDASVSKAAAVEDSQGQSSSIPTSASSGKAEVSFGTSSFAAAELTYGHYHHDHHRTPSEAEVGSVASFAEASSAGATFGGSDHVSDGTYSDGDYASETRSVFGNSSAHSTAFITEPASSSDGQASNEDNGTYDHQSDMSSTVGGGGGAPSSEFDVSSTRSALFENEVASTGFEQGDDAYDYGEHSHHNHFEGSYDNEYSHGISESTTEFTEEARSAFDHTHDSEFSNSGFGAPPAVEQSPSPMYSRSSTPATYGVSSSQDLPTASDLEFDHSDSDNMFANSSSQQDSVPFGESSGDEVGLEAPKLTVTSAPATNVSGPFESDSVADDPNPFASSGTGFPSPPAPPSFAPPPSDTSPYGTSNSVDEALPSADSLFGASPAKNSPFGSFGASPAPPSHPVAYEDAPVSDAGSLFADAPPAPAFGGYEPPTPASASSFFGGGQGTPHNYGYDNAPPQYGYETASHPLAADAFAGSNQSHGFEANAYAYEESFQSASETFGGPVQSNEFNGDYGYDTKSHHSAAEAFGGSANGGFGAHNDSSFDGFGGSSGDAVSADSFFGGGSSAPTSAEDMFGSSNALANEDQHGFGYHHGSEDHPSVDNSRSTVVEESVPTQVDDRTDIVNNSGVALEAPGALSFDSKELRQNVEFHQEYHQPEGQWAYDAQTETQSFDGQQASHATAEADMSTNDGHHGGPPSADQDYPSFGGTHDVDSFFGRSASAPPHDMYPATESPSADKRFASFPPRSNGSPPRAPEASWTDQNTESAAAPRDEQPISQPSDIGHGFGETSAPLENQSLDEGAEDHFAADGTYAASPFEQTAESEQQSGSSAFFGGNSTSDAFGEASPFDQTTNSTQATDSSAYFGGESTGGGFGEYPPYEQNAEPSHEADPSAFFGSQDSSNAFGASTDNGASGFFSGGPSQQHHAGGVYAHPPQDSSSPAYQSYEQASYGHQQESYAGYENHAGGYATGHDYAYGDHNQSSSTGANQTGQQSSSVGYGSTASHDYRSPTAAGSAHFVSAQSTSAFEYHSSTEAAPYPHNDASYHTPTLQPRPAPSTPKMDPSPLHGVKAHTNCNQFAAPVPAPAYGSAYESKPAYAQAAGTVGALTSNKHKDPNMVAPSCLASFGFGGNVVTMFPKQKLRLNASFAARNSPRTPQSMQFDNAPQGELRKGPVGVYRMENVHPRNTDFEELDKFPGPLNDSVTEEAILQYVEEKMSSASGSTHQDEDERLLLGILRVLIKCNGRLRSDANSNPSDPSSPEVQLVSLLKESDQRRRRNHPSNFPPPKPVQYPTHPDAMLRNASRVRELLLLGDRKAAVDVAIQAQMWPEAMLIGSFTDKDEYKRVLCAYFTSHYAPGDPCRALYLSFADQQERSVHEPQKLLQHSKDENSSEILSTWVVHVQMLLANRTADTNKILVELGDRLWKEANAVVAAHVCYLLAGNTVEAPSPSSKIALLGADHRSPDEARFYVSPSAVQRTEIYEWVQKRINPAATNMIPFQGYKLIYAMILADHGKLETAFKYVNSMLTVIRAITATMKPGTSMYLEGMQNQLIVLDDRLRQHLGQDRADSVAAAASAKQGKQWGLGSALSIMGKIVNRVVEGNDTPQQATAPRSTNGSLFPGAPRSNNNNVNAPPEYPSGAAVGYSSQSGPSMVPSAPGSGRSGGIYASHPGPYNPASAPQPMVAPPSAHVPPPVQAPSVPAAFNVPRQLSGRNSAPPHQPVSDFSAPSSGSGGNAYPAPLSGGNGFNAPPPQASQPPPSYPQNSFNQPPVAEAPPPFQKPTLDLSGNAGKSNYGNEAAQTDTSTPKSPPRSPRRGSGAPGSDKGSASPKAKEVPKKGGRSKTPPPSRSSSGWLSGISTFIAAKMNPDAKVAKLGEHMDAYFDEEKKRWVFPGETQTDEPTMPSAPPTGPLPGSMPGSSSGGPPGGPPGAHSAPGSMAGGAAANDPLAALMAPPPARALMKKDPLAAMMAPPPNRTAFGQRSTTMPAKRPPPRPQFAVFKPAPGSQASSAPSEQGPPSSSGEPPAPPQ